MLGMTAGYTCWILTLAVMGATLIVVHVVGSIAEVRKATHADSKARAEARIKEMETAQEKSRAAVEMARLERGLQ